MKEKRNNIAQKINRLLPIGLIALSTSMISPLGHDSTGNRPTVPAGQFQPNSELPHQLFLPIIERSKSEIRIATVHTAYELYKTLDQWQQERQSNPDVAYHYDLVIGNDIALDKFIPVSVTTTEIEPKPETLQAAVVLPDDITVKGNKPDGKKPEIRLDNQDIGFYAPQSMKLFMNDIIINRTRSKPAAYDGTGKLKDPSDFASVHVTSKDGTAAFLGIEIDNTSGEFGEDKQKYSGIKINGAHSILAFYTMVKNGSWDAYTLHDFATATIDNLDSQRNNIGSQFAGAVIGATSSFNRQTGTLIMQNLHSDGSHKPIGVYVGIIKEGDHYKLAGQKISTTLQNISFDQTHTNLPVWYAFTQTASGGNVTIDNMRFNPQAYVQVIVSDGPDTSISISNSSFTIQHFDNRGKFYLRNGDGKVMPDLSDQILDVTNTNVSIYRVPDQASIPTGYDAYGLPHGELQKLRDMGFSVAVIDQQ